MSRHRLHPECTGRVEADAVSVERARTKICGSCSKHFVQGERPAYQCLACDFYVCVNCERPIYHPAHPENALYLTIKKSSWRCDVCRKSSIDLKDKRFYSCDESYFKMCVDCSKEIRTTLHPHPLLHTDTRYTYPQTNGEWNCDICRNNNGPGHYYPAHCALSCEFDLCDNCLKPYRSTFHPAHAMYKADSNVVYASFNGGWRCDRCSQSFNPHNNNIPYHCSICEFDLCESCMKTTADPSNAAGFDVARPEVQPANVDRSGKYLSHLGNPITSPSEETEDIGRAGAPDGSGECVICLERPKDATIVHGDTGHVCCCMTCALHLYRTRSRCPICREPIDRIIKQYTV